MILMNCKTRRSILDESVANILILVDVSKSKVTGPRLGEADQEGAGRLKLKESSGLL
jgi:hypothetical protein